MSSTSALTVVDENYSDENIAIDKTAIKCMVLSPQKSILKDSNVCHVLHSSPCSTENVKVVIDLSFMFNMLLFITHASISASVGRAFSSVCLSVCLQSKRKNGLSCQHQNISAVTVLKSKPKP